MWKALIRRDSRFSFFRLFRPASALLVTVLTGAPLDFGFGQVASPGSDDPLRGPFISNSAVIELLDCPTSDCAGPLNFSKLLTARETQTGSINSQNPFNLPIAAQILKTIQRDLKTIRMAAHATDGQLSPNFLTDEGSRAELVGIVNRMDRQFVKDPSLNLSLDQLRCGEVSLIYRFSYSIREGKQKSRLPVTMNIVLPSVPFNNQGGAITCQKMAGRWLNYISNPVPTDPAEAAKGLLNPSQGPLAFITGHDILRVELNMQVYRKPARADTTNFGTEAGYLMRVFKWDPPTRLFLPDILRNQIDRDKVVCSPTPSNCDQIKARRQALVRFLQRPEIVASIDNGTLEIDSALNVLASFAVSISPGGSHRSENQVYWNNSSAARTVISDVEIQKALDAAKSKGVRLQHMKSVEDFRSRLNESACSGCHQTRAIAGFHFPGSDRDSTPAVNAVHVPGSPHFYGDQVRRIEILQKMASQRNTRLSERELASSYAARPFNRHADVLKNTQLVGGWGGACLTGEVRQTSQRQWDCREGLECKRLFDSKNDPGIGTCLPKGRFEVGDALQEGRVETSAFGSDKYVRTSPDGPDKRIPIAALPSPSPTGNSYYGAHQEFYEGDISSSDKVVRRDALTGGFPAGMLRLSECVNLPKEATCGLIASSGFNDCVGRLRSDTAYSVNTCFRHFTSYAGVRACDRANPCRDDYICVKPMGYRPDTAVSQFTKRRQDIASSPYFRAINNRDYDPTDFGQKQPDENWISRDDQRGLCIPPYFVFQFRSDGHPAPAITTR